MSGHLRQEMREPQTLDEITRLRHEGKLPSSVTDLRDPPHFHHAMKWDSTMGPRIPENKVYDEWRPSGQKDRKRKNAAVDHSRPQKVSDERPSKKLKNADADQSHVAVDVISAARPSPTVARYDATFTVLRDIWLDDEQISSYLLCFKKRSMRWVSKPAENADAQISASITYWMLGPARVPQLGEMARETF
ncbi:hypothetical protein C8R44DRAFT_752889 [Mycena epipterygia]|nr:hypothetical protein C8R44DRAFT_752889 [Mycena epipterygia]